MLLSVVIIAAFGSCSNISLVSEDQMEEDLKSEMQSNGSDVSISNLEIEKRITDEDNKTDTVYIWCNVDTPEFTAHQGYILNYILYNDGWEYEDYSTYDETNWTSKPLTPVYVNEAVSYMKTACGIDGLSPVGGEPMQIDDSDSNNITCTAICKFEETGKLFDIEVECTSKYVWNDQYSIWEIVDSNISSSKRNFSDNIAGKWEMNEDNKSATLTIGKNDDGFYIEDMEFFEDGHLWGTLNNIALEEDFEFRDDYRDHHSNIYEDIDMTGASLATLKFQMSTDEISISLKTFMNHEYVFVKAN